MSSILPHDNVVPEQQSDQGKKQQVKEMFNSIARRYDFLNRFLSMGIDRSWRKKAINELRPFQPEVVLDMACGTGDMCIRLAKLPEVNKIIGMDISSEMLRIGREKIENENLTEKVELLEGDSEAINFSKNTFDAITVAFGVRNFEKLETGLAELCRVLKPGAPLVILEFSRPRNPMFRRIYQLYMSRLAPVLAGWFSSNRKAYQYLDRSARLFPEREQFVEILKKTGFTNAGYKPLSLGICCIYRGIKG